MLKGLLVTSVVILVAIGITPGSSPSGGILFRGDYETGDFSQWQEPQSACTGNGYSAENVGNSCAAVVSTPAHQGSRAGRFQIGAHTSGAAGAERAEVYAPVAETGGSEGKEWYYAWSTMFPAAGNPLGFLPNFENWNVFTDFHNPGACNSNIQLGVNATGASPLLYFEDDNFPRGNCSKPSSMLYTNLGNLQFDRWYDFVLHVKWSRDPTVGFVELWLDGVKVVPLAYRQTMADVSGASVYWKQGFYRSAFGGLNTVYHDGAVRGDSFAAVAGGATTTTGTTVATTTVATTTPPPTTTATVTAPVTTTATVPTIRPTATSVTTVAAAERVVPNISSSPHEELVRARPVWRGDYETGTFAQWSDVQASRTNREYPVSSVGDSSAVVLSTPVREGTRAAEFVTYPNTGHSDADRSEVLTSVSETGGFEGQEWYYAWSTRFPSAGNRQGFWSRGGDFNVFTQWHNANDPCGNNLQFGIDSATAPGTNRLYSDLTTKNPRDCDQDVRNAHAILGRLRFDEWYDFVVRVKWSSDPSVGFYEAWMNGIQVVPKTYGQTMFDSRGAYWKQGFYRAPFAATNSVFEDGAVRGPSLEAVTRTLRLSFAARPRLRARNALEVSARSFAQARLSIVIQDERGRVVGSRRVRSDGDGRVRSTVPIRKSTASRLRVSLRALVSPRLPVATRRAQIVVALPR